MPVSRSLLRASSRGSAADRPCVSPATTVDQGGAMTQIPFCSADHAAVRYDCVPHRQPRLGRRSRLGARQRTHYSLTISGTPRKRRARRTKLHLHSQRLRFAHAHAGICHCEPAVVGHLLQQQRPVIRHADRGERRDLFEHRYRGQRRQPHGNASGLQRAGAAQRPARHTSATACSTAGHLGHAADSVHGRQRLCLPAHGE